MQTQTERELKFDVAASFRLPDLTGVLGAPSEVRTSVVHLTSTYFDAADHPLLAHHITLRRREGDTDTGWHLKLPAGTARTEIRLPLEAGHTHVPSQLADIVAGLTGGHGLQPVATVRTERHIYGVYAGETLLVEVADDHVTGISMGAIARTTQWREIEAELVGGTEKMLGKIDKRLLSAGAQVSASSSKLAQTLQADTTDATDAGAAPPPPAAAIFEPYVRAHIRTLGLGDVDLRRGFDDVHRTRVAARRLRSTLRVFALVLDAGTAQHLDAELSWYQALLGEVRDAQVQRKRLAASIAALPEELVLGPVAGYVEQVLQAEQVKALARVQAALDSTRYHALLAAVRAWAEQPLAHDGPPPSELRKLAAKARRTAAKRLRRGLEADDVVALHKARKAAKRARYAAELVGAGRTSIKTYKKLQDVLGEHQDSVLAAANLRRIGTAAGIKRGHNGFTYGLLFEREQATAVQLRARAQAFGR
jgi:CHAD domain-containing protein